ncbi:MAG TPA: hypothetical protein VFQ35_24715 [Polyangiaceae bacterium]|nr:hypothetical protein [Polyangiaceae bacterium]
MTETTDIDDGLAALYRVARTQEAPTHADRLAVRAAVASTLATSASLASTQVVASSVVAAPATKAAITAKVATWLCAGIALGGVSSSVAWVLSEPPDVVIQHSAALPPGSASASNRAYGRRSPLPSESVAGSRGASVLDSPGESSARLPTSAPLSIPSARPRATPNRSREVTETRALRSGVEPSSLLAESEGVQRVQQALANGDASRAIQLLAEQDSRFRDGALAEERAALGVLALCAKGQSEAAEAARQRFLVTYPRSPHEVRLRNSCTK